MDAAKTRSNAEVEVCRQLLDSGLTALNLHLTEYQISQLIDFIRLMDKWNKAYNLTAIRNPEDMIYLHLLDSLAIVPFIAGQRVIDIGTGAGLPGIPLAVCLPDTAFTLLDSNAKKTRFVQQAVLELKLNNVTVCHHRVENYHPESPFNTVITRAFASLSEIVRLTAHLLAPDGVLLAMKGQHLEAELAQLSEQLSTQALAKKSVISVSVPGIAAERCLVRIASLTPTEVMSWEK
ncbi:MAG: 16S rRNA (guanine(527)-N(7))-methyltransferase RsmG [Methylovulum sp.]|nr:16S rRNA (guanine(527)-N(7))-methyltransferase RsmG [Methylovulum sp.]